MRNLHFILLISIFLTGCGNTLKTSWKNFNAYYNTFYNAKRRYKDGLKKVENQPVAIDPAKPVRIHPTPLQAGSDDFQLAIEKGARILQKHPDSKWVDDAILLMGKSYYYQGEFYSAIQNFEELEQVTSVPKMHQQAIIWKGRTQLDLKQFAEGVSFLESKLRQYPDGWSNQSKGEIQALVAQHYGMLGSWEESADYLFKAVSNLRDKKLVGRTYFLLGQALEQLERFGESFNAFGDVAANFPDFEYLYWSRFKQADIARQARRFNLAFKIFQNLRNDDKNSRWRNHLLYEIARTNEMMGEPEEAEKLYKELLHNSNNRQQMQDLRMDIYFRLGKIYSENFAKYDIAAAYFDSSSAISTRSTKTKNDDKEATELANVYGEYTKLQQSIARADSLLHMGSLSKPELDSLLAKIRKQRNRVDESRGKEENEVVITTEQVIGDGNSTEMLGQYGYLSYKNTELKSRYKKQFRVIWGDRPLVDNWRRAEAIRNMDFNESSEKYTDQRFFDRENSGETVAVLNLKEIPQTPQQELLLKKEKVAAQYELGNMLFLNLNMPDSARYYFHKVINSKVSEQLRPRAMYSLFEIFSTLNTVDSLEYWGNSILESYPKTEFAERVQRRLTGQPVQRQEEPAEILEERYRQIKEDTMAQKPARLKLLALEYREQKEAPRIFYSAIEAYIEQAKAGDRQFGITKFDSLSKTTDSINTDVDYLVKNEQQLSFSGPKWDSVRLAIQQFDTTFPKSALLQRVDKMRELLQQSNNTDISTCEEMGLSVQLVPGMDAFLENVSWPEELQDKSLAGNIVYSFVISSSGEIQSYELESPKTSLGVEGAFEEAFDTYLKFEPLNITNTLEQVRCRVTFPVRQ